MTSTAAITFATLLVLALPLWNLSRMFGRGPVWLEQPFLFFGLVCLSMLVLRWPQITWSHEINADESQMLAQGMRFMSHPVPWRDVDGMTGGPLDSQVLTMLMYLGAPASWEMARIFLWASNCLTVIFLYLTLRCFGTRAEAQFLVLPTILFYAFAVHPDFIHYSSETLSVTLLAAGLYLLAKTWCENKPSKLRWFLMGLVAGAVPFAKLQAGPLGLFLVLVGFLQIFMRRRQPQGTGWSEAGALCLGTVAVPALILSVVGLCGAFDDFWKSYILASVSYVGQEGILIKEMNLERVLFGTPDFSPYVYTAAWAAMFLPIAWLARKNRLGGALGWTLLVVAVDCMLTFACLLAAGKDYYHYVLLLIPALAILFGLVFLAGKAMLQGQNNPNPENSVAYLCWLIAFCVLIAALQFHNTTQYRINLLQFRAELLRRGPPTMSLVSRQLLAARQPGDAMSVWGWMPAYHVETGIPPAAREVLGACLITDIPNRDYFRQNYLADLEKSRPAWFIDAIAGNTFTWYWVNPGTHESFPELGKFIHDNYDLWLSVHMTNQTSVAAPIRIYALKQRMAEQHLLPAELSAPADPYYMQP